MKRSIYYSERHGDYVSDEMCECGHLKSEHGSKLMPLNGSTTIRESNEGSCCNGVCACGQFSFARFVLLEEAAQLALGRRPLELA